MDNGGGGQYDAEPYLAVLDRFEQQANRRFSLLQAGEITIVGVALLVTLIGQISGYLDDYLPAYISIVVFGGLMMLVSRSGVAFDRNAQMRLDNSDLAGRLARGELTRDIAREHLNFLVRLFVRPLAAGDRLGQLWRIARHLHFHLSPPRRFVPQGCFIFWLILIVGCFYTFIALSAGGPILLTVHLIGLPIILLMANLLAHGDSIYARQLAAYLRRRWADGGSKPREGRLPNPTTQLLLMTNQLEDDTRMAVGQLAGPYLGLGIWPVGGSLIWAGNALARELEWYNAGWQILICAILFGLVLAAYTGGAAWHRRRITRRLAQTDIVMRVALGELNYHEIEAHVPWLFRKHLDIPAMPKGYADDLRKMIWRLAFNLDWYLRPPRLLVRASWIGSAVGLLLVLVTILLAFAGIPFDSTSLVVIILVLLDIAFLLVWWDAVKYSIWSRLVVSAVRQRLLAE
ncbi:hypothetical protein JW859_05655 [bacterium]|nr:hypothetical protein [bacterium]